MTTTIIHLCVFWSDRQTNGNIFIELMLINKKNHTSISNKICEKSHFPINKADIWNDRLAIQIR